MPQSREQPRVRLRGLLGVRDSLIRALRAGGLGLVLSCLAPAGAAAWGGRTHEIINRRAAAAVPGPAGEAWGPLAGALGAHASDADRRKSSSADEPERHYLDADVWDDPPFRGVPRRFEELARRHGRERAERFGTLPWAIQECYRMVVLSLRRGDWSSAGAWAADLGHYVADAHQPLHGTANYDGQKSGNEGIHLRFEVTMMDRFLREESLPSIEPAGEPPRGEDVVDLVFSWIAEASPGVATILSADDRARAADPAYGGRYYEVLWSGAGALARTQVARAVRDLAALYAAAWIEAGRPPPPEEVLPLRARPPDELAPPAAAPEPAPLRALFLAGAVILGALALGSR